jgi:cyclohexadienyl dehydratase
MQAVFLSLSLALGWLLSAPVRAESGHLERVLAVRQLRVCISPDYYGISYRNPHTQQLTGLDVDMARALAKDLGVQARFVDSSFSKVSDDVSQDRCDIAMFAIGISPAKAEKLRFVRAHLVSDIYGITTLGNRRIKNWSDIDKPGVVVAVLKGTVVETVLRERLRAATLLLVDNAHAREEEVESGRADVFMTDYPYSRRMLDNVEWARLVSPASAYHLMTYAYAVPLGDEAWHARVEQFVAAIKRDGRLLASARTYKLDSIVAPQ